MPNVTFIDPDGTERTVSAEPGDSVMEAAIEGEVPGIVAECGGSCACATCHVYVEPEWLAKVGERSGDEEDMLDLAYDVKDNSRLSCQITVNDSLDGLTVRVASRQI